MSKKKDNKKYRHGWASEGKAKKAKELRKEHKKNCSCYKH